MAKHATQKKQKKTKKKLKKDVRGELDRVLLRVEDEASDQLEVILSGAREDAAETAVAMRGLHAMVQSDMNEALLEVSNGCVQLREGLAQFNDARAAAETSAHECDARERERLEQADRRSQEIAADLDGLVTQLRAGAEARIDDVYHRVEEHAVTCEHALELAQREATERITESQRLVDEQARRFGEHVSRDLAELLEDVDRKTRELQELSQLRIEGAVATIDERSVAALGRLDGLCEQVEERSVAALGRLDGLCEQVEERSVAALGRLDGLCEQVDERSVAALGRLDGLCEQVEERSAAVLGSLDGLCEQVDERSVAALGRLDGLCEQVDERSVAALGRLDGLCEQVDARSAAVLGSLDEVSAQARSDAEAVNRRRIEYDELADSLIAFEAEARGCAADAHEALDQLREHVASAAGLEAQLSPDRDAGVPSENSTDPRPDRGDDELLGDRLDEPFDENFFGKLAEDLRSEPDRDEFPGGIDDSDSGPAGWDTPRPVDGDPQGAPAQRIALLDPILDTPVADISASTPTAPAGPVTVVAPLSGLTGLVEELARTGNTSVRISIAHSAANPASSTCVQLVTYDTAGWWKCGEVPVAGGKDLATSVVVDLEELREALEVTGRFGESTDVHITLDNGATIGNHLLLAQPSDDVPLLDGDRRPIEHIDLDSSKRLGLVLETQAGRLFVAPELLGYLRHRKAAAAQLVSIGGFPYLSTQVRTVAGNQEMTIVGRLLGLGENDEPTVIERRSTPGNEVTQLVNALSLDATPAELEHILKVGVGYTRRRAAAHPALPPEVIDDLINDGTEAMRAAAASNISISAEAIELAIADTSAVVRAAAASNPSLPAEGAEQLAHDPVPHVRSHLASNPKATGDLLDQLAQDHDSSVRAAVAFRENISTETLLTLARDPDGMVCEAVAQNSACPPEVLSELVSIVPGSVLANPNAAPSLLVAGSSVNVSRLREAVARNPATPAKGLRKLARDTDPDVLRAVAEHPGTSSSTRRRARRALGGT